MILLVVNMHACVTYSHVGGWYYVVPRQLTLAQQMPFLVWQLLLQSFFMGVLFFLAGYFAHHSLGRRGTASFVRERLFRLGLPSLLFMFALHPFILLALNPWHANFGPWLGYYGRFLRRGWWLDASGPMWFTLALLVFCLILAGWRRLIRPAAPPASSAGPNGESLVTFALLLGVGTFIVRLSQPLGTNFHNMQLGYFVQYIGFFAAGLAAARGGWLLPLAASPLARKAGWAALVGSPLALIIILLAGADGGAPAFDGGWHWQAFALAAWEQLTGIGLSLGLLALFSRKLNGERPALRWMSDRSFAVYTLHAPVLIGLTMLLMRLPIGAYPSAALLTLATLAATFLLADLARRVPGLRAIL